MQGIWCWLSIHSSQLQAFGSIAAVVVALALGVVAVAQARAAFAQARAAEAQVRAANRQIRASYIVGDIQTSPHIWISYAASKDGVVIPQTMAILNNGNGTASNVKLFYRDNAANNQFELDNDVLVAPDSLPVRFDLSRAVASGFKLTYRTSFGTQCELDFEWHASASRPLNQRLAPLLRDFSVLGLDTDA